MNSIEKWNHTFYILTGITSLGKVYSRYALSGPKMSTFGKLAEKQNSLGTDKWVQVVMRLERHLLITQISNDAAPSSR
jgi:hypothetical protein